MAGLSRSDRGATFTRKFLCVEVERAAKAVGVTTRSDAHIAGRVRRARPNRHGVLFHESAGASDFRVQQLSVPRRSPDRESGKVSA